MLNIINIDKLVVGNHNSSCIIAQYWGCDGGKVLIVLIWVDIVVYLGSSVGLKRQCDQISKSLAISLGHDRGNRAQRSG